MITRRWLRKWTIGLIVAVLGVAVIASFSLWMNDQMSRNQSLTKQPGEARVLINDILLLLGEDEVSTDPAKKASLDHLLDTRQVNLIYMSLSGQVLYSNDPEARDRLDIRYKGYEGIDSDERTGDYEVLFPVLNEAGTQVGNAWFIIPRNLLPPNNPVWPMYLAAVMAAVLLLVLGLLWAHNRKLKKNLYQPLSIMQQKMEVILRENPVDRPATISDASDMEQFTAVFDQMCLHVQHVNLVNAHTVSAQKDLIANMSHDIRTPLATIKAYTDGVLEGVCPDMPAVMQYVEVIRGQAEKMDHLVNDLFYHSLKQLGQISVNLETCYSEAVFARINASLKSLVEAKGIRWKEQDQMPNVLMKADANRLEQVMENLVSNAAKHTEAGGLIRVEVEIEDAMLKVSVIDDGEGISPDDIPFVFDRFYQGHYNNDKKNEGAGLGLSICKYIIEAHGGQIFFITAKGEGTTFSFTLPIF